MLLPGHVGGQTAHASLLIERAGGFGGEPVHMQAVTDARIEPLIQRIKPLIQRIADCETSRPLSG